MKKSLLQITLVILGVLTVSCQPVSRHTQRATATAYAASYMNDAMQAAEQGALALCNIDFTAGGEQYLQAICDVSTQPACEFFKTRIAETWADLARSMSAEQLKCIPGTSRFLEEGSQFGRAVQFWKVNLVGTEGWTSSASNREYWVQVTEENGSWRLNRVLTGDEVAFYQTIDQMAGMN